jgi:hypothetical protein
MHMDEIDGKVLTHLGQYCLSFIFMGHAPTQAVNAVMFVYLFTYESRRHVLPWSQLYFL